MGSMRYCPLHFGGLHEHHFILAMTLFWCSGKCSSGADVMVMGIKSSRYFSRVYPELLRVWGARIAITGLSDSGYLNADTDLKGLHIIQHLETLQWSESEDSSSPAQTWLALIRIDF